MTFRENLYKFNATTEVRGTRLDTRISLEWTLHPTQAAHGVLVADSLVEKRFQHVMYPLFAVMPERVYSSLGSGLGSKFVAQSKIDRSAGQIVSVDLGNNFVERLLHLPDRKRLQSIFLRNVVGPGGTILY